MDRPAFSDRKKSRRIVEAARKAAGGICFACICATALPAGDLESFNTAEYKFLERGRTEWYAGGGLRLRNGLGDVYDRRVYAGGVVGLGHGIHAGFRYLFRYKQEDDDGLKPNQRVTVSLGYPLHHGHWAVLGGSYVERQFSRKGEADFSRYRQRFEIERGGDGSTPWLSYELAFLRDGLARSRSRAGWKWRLEGGTTVSLGYQFDSVRDGHAWGPRHAIVTEFEFSRPKAE